MELLVGTSLVAAFIAGLAALFAPCCITVLLPSYFASIFRQKEKVFLMTFIFFLGIATVFLPLGLGVAALGAFLSQYHNSIFAVGGLFLLAMGLTQLSGKHFSLPFTVHPKLKDGRVVSIYSLGIFSGIATTCCAPVLAGVLALAALPGSIFWGGAYTLSYVLGMTVPLFIIASFIDKTEITKKFTSIRKPFGYEVAGRKVVVTLAEAVSGVTFLAMGSLILYMAMTNKLFTHSEYQTDINIYLTNLLGSINSLAGFVPEYIWAMVFTGILLVIIRIAFKQLNIKKNIMNQKNNFSNNMGMAIGAIGVISLIVAMLMVQGNKPQNNNMMNSGDISGNASTDMTGHNSGGASNNMASHHSSTTPQNTPDLNAMIGKPASNFSLTDKDGKTYSLESLKGKNVVLFFNEGLMCYPACWNQIVALSEDERFNNTVALSVVVDSKEKWQSAINKMPALANATVVFDNGAVVSKKFNMLNTKSSMHYGSFPGHTFIIIDKEGIIRYIFDDPSMGIRNDQLIAEIGKISRS